MFRKEDNPYYNGNRKLKNTGTTTEWEPWQIEEMKKCAADPVYFISKYVKIITLDRGLVNIDLYPFQPDFINHMHREKYSIAKFPRQTAKTTTAACYICWCLLFNKATRAALLANKLRTAREMLSRIQKMYEELPFWMQSGVKTWNKTMIELDNDARVEAVATTLTGIRGISCITKDSIVTIKDRKTEEVKSVNIEFLINQLGELDTQDISNITPNNKYDILGKDGFEHFSGIINKGMPEKLLKLTFDNDSFIKCTPDHEFIINDENILAKNIKKGKIFGIKSVVNVENINVEEVYDIANCSETHTYYANGVLNHNCNIIYLDEFAFIPNDIAEEFFATVWPTLSTAYDKAKCIITSTPKGYNHFYEKWKGAVEGTNNFKTFEVTWDAVPSRDQKWLDEQRAELGEKKFNQEILCVAEDTIITIRNKKTGIIEHLSIGDLYARE